MGLLFAPLTFYWIYQEQKRFSLEGAESLIVMLDGLVEESGHYRLAAQDEAGSAALVTGPSHHGGFLAFAPDADRISRGPSVAPRVIDAFRVADRSLGVPLGPLEPALPVR